MVDESGNKLDYEVDSYGDNITVNLKMRPYELSQFIDELLLRHPGMEFEVEDIINDISLKNHLVKP